MEFGYYERRIDEDTTGKYDLTPVFADGEAFAHLVEDLTAPVDLDACTHVAGIEALGFLLAGAVAERADVGVVPIRKEGNLPLADGQVHRRTAVDYTGEPLTLELSALLCGPGDRVLLVDDWIETGGQMRAAVDLVEATGATVAAISVLRAEDSEGCRALAAEYEVHGVG